MEGIDDLDIYDDLDEFQEVQEKKSKELQDIESRYQESLKENALLQMENKQLQKTIKTLEVNFQNLLDTAKSEIRRKNLLIDELRKEKDDICFRRKSTNNPSDEQQQSTKETNIETKKQNEEKYEREKTKDNNSQQIYSRREARKDYRERERDRDVERDLDRNRERDRDCERNRDRLPTRRSRSKEKVTEYKSRDIHFDARSILNSKVKRKQECEENLDKEAKRSKFVKHQEEKHSNLNDNPKEYEKHINGSSGMSNDLQNKPNDDLFSNHTNNSVDETLKKAVNSIENIVEELEKEINELSKDNFIKKDTALSDNDISAPTNEQQDQHSFDDYIELFAETDLSDVETPVQTPLKKTEIISLNDLCEPIESDEELEDICNFTEDKNDEKKFNTKSENYEKERKPTRKTTRLAEEHKKLFGESDEDDNLPIVNSNEKRKEKEKLRLRSTYKTESFLRITITSPKRRKEQKEKLKVVKKVKVTEEEAVERKYIQKTEIHEENLTKEIVNDEKEKNKEIKENLKEDVKENREIKENEKEKEKNIEIKENLKEDVKENREIKENEKEKNKKIKENLKEDVKENREIEDNENEKNKEIKESFNENEREINKEKENNNEFINSQEIVMDTSIEDASVSKKLMENIFGTDNNHSWLGFKIPKKTTTIENKKEEEVVENKANVPIKTRTRARRKVTVIKKLENSKENEAETAKKDEHINDVTNQTTSNTTTTTTTKTDESDIISPKTSALLDEIFEKTANESLEKLAEKEKTPQSSPKADNDNEVEIRMRNIFQSPMNASIESNDRPTILSNISLANNTQILDLILEQSQNNPTTTTTLEQLPIDNQLSDLIVEQTQKSANVDTSNLSEVSAATSTLNSSTETKEMVMGSSKYVFEKVSDNTVHLFITRNKNRRRKKVATQLNSPVVLPTMET